MYSCIAIRERVVEVAELFPIYCPPTSLNGFQCLVRARWRNRPFLHLPLNAHTRFPPNKEDFGIGVVVPIKHEDCEQQVKPS